MFSDSLHVFLLPLAPRKRLLWHVRLQPGQRHHGQWHPGSVLRHGQHGHRPLCVSVKAHSKSENSPQRLIVKPQRSSPGRPLQVQLCHLSHDNELPVSRCVCLQLKLITAQDNYLPRPHPPTTKAEILLPLELASGNGSLAPVHFAWTALPSASLKKRQSSVWTQEVAGSGLAWLIPTHVGLALRKCRANVRPE